MKYGDGAIPRAAAALLCVLLGAACDEAAPTGPSVPLNQQFTLAPGDSTAILGTSVHLRFVRVSGDALVHVAASGNTSAEYDLHTADPTKGVVRHDGVRIALVSLQPYPFGSRG